MRKIAILSATIAAVALSGCLGGGGSGPSRINRSLESVHQPVVTQQNFTFDANAASGELSATELRRVSDWLGAMDVRYGDRISIDESAVYGARAARESVSELLRRDGLMLAENAPLTPGAIQPGHIRVVLTRADARVDGCPNWRTRSATDFHSTTTSNYGCATNANLATMVADPMDLVRGQNSRSNDPLTASRAIEGYRQRASQNGGQLPGSGGGGNGGGGTPPAPGGGQ